MQIRNGDIDLHVATDGDPSLPPILLLHGITSFGGTWDWIVPTLVERFRVLRLDFRGHGQSGRAPGQYGAADYVSDAVAALQQAAGQPCVVMGHSLGGATTAALAQRHADLLVAAIMEDPPLGVPDGSAGAASLEGNTLLDGFRQMRESIPMLQEAKMPRDVLIGMLAAAPDTTGTETFGTRLHADGIASMAGSLLAADATVLDGVLSGTIESFVDPTVPFAVPSLVVCADPASPDAVADPNLAHQFADLSADAEVLVIEGAGHLIHDELASRDTFRDAVMTFLDRVTATP